VADALQDKVAAITGATSGSGRAIARRFAAEGAQVVLLARGKERLVADTEELGANAIGIATDVGDVDKVRQAFAEIEERFGKLDILVNNAAVHRPCFVEELSDFDIERQVRTNYLGPVYTCRAAIPLLRAAGGGDIVNTSSESTLDPFPMLSMYVSSKAALEAFSRTMMTEVDSDDIRITLVIQGTAHEGEGSTDWGWEPERATKAYELWAERGYLARVLGRGGRRGSSTDETDETDETNETNATGDVRGHLARVLGREGSRGQSTDDIAEVHLFAVTRPRGQKLDTIHVRSR
jgi:NAD(P)-dependent dehydrogenase (short-subunit alcohol dehydrogenase family)